MLNRIPFRDIIQEFGQIIAVSNDGLNLVLKKQTQKIVESKQSESDKMKEFMSLHIFTITAFELEYVKSVNIFEGIMGCVNLMSQTKSE